MNALKTLWGKWGDLWDDIVVSIDSAFSLIRDTISSIIRRA